MSLHLQSGQALTLAVRCMLRRCVLLMFMVEQDQLRTVLRELFVEYLSDSCKFSLHWKATSLYLLSSRLRQVVLEWLWMCEWLG